LESTNPDEQVAKDAFTNIFSTAKAIFEPYLRGAAENIGGLKGKTIGNIFINPNFGKLFILSYRKLILWIKSYSGENLLF
jgi:hypothetical protein